MNWYDFEFRTYDPQLGRWCQANPLMQHASSYLAMSNNPVLFTDPLGLWDDDVYGNDDDPIKGKLLREVVVYAQRPLSGSTQDGAYFGSSGSDAFSGGSSTGATLDYIQEGIDWIGVFDPTGIADFTNGTLFTIRGDYKNAAISYAGVLPGGDLLKAGRLGAKMAARASLIAMPILVKEGKNVYNAIQAGRRAATGGGGIVDELVRVRHHTSSTGLSGIKSSGSINASRGVPYGVDVEVAPFLKPSQVNMGQAGRGSFVEFSIQRSQLSPIPSYMGGAGIPGRIVTGGAPLNIQNANPSFVRWNWWPF